jgi:hypothetical protein
MTDSSGEFMRLRLRGAASGLGAENAGQRGQKGETARKHGEIEARAQRAEPTHCEGEPRRVTPRTIRFAVAQRPEIGEAQRPSPPSEAHRQGEKR